MGVKHEEVLGQTSFILHIDVILCQSVIKERAKMIIQKKSKRKIALMIIKILVILGILGLLIVLGMDRQVKKEGGKHLTTLEESRYTKAKPADCALVLGASVYVDRKPSPMLKDRLDRGIELYKAGIVKKLLFSGDNGQVEYNEVEAMKEYALKAGVKKKDIFLDHAGFSTYESVYRAKSVFAVKSMIVVTQQYHEYRALYTGEKLGLEVEGIPAEDVTYRGQTMRYLREVLARAKDMGKCMYEPEPTFLGDVIPISGDGRKTW